MGVIPAWGALRGSSRQKRRKGQPTLTMAVGLRKRRTMGQEHLPPFFPGTSHRPATGSHESAFHRAIVPNTTFRSLSRWRRHPDSNRGMMDLQSIALATWPCRLRGKERYTPPAAGQPYFPGKVSGTPKTMRRKRRWKRSAARRQPRTVCEACFQLPGGGYSLAPPG